MFDGISNDFRSDILFQYCASFLENIYSSSLLGLFCVDQDSDLTILNIFQAL